MFKKSKDVSSLLDQLSEMSKGVISFSINGRTYSFDDEGNINCSEGFKQVDFDFEKFYVDYGLLVQKFEPFTGIEVGQE